MYATTSVSKHRKPDIRIGSVIKPVRGCAAEFFDGLYQNERMNQCWDKEPMKELGLVMLSGRRTSSRHALASARLVSH